ANGLWNRLESRKPIFVEPRRKVEFTEAMEGFYEKIRNPDNKGAVFLAVCRGKVSEGVDFSDINGRAVIITGLPYPPTFDARVKLKQQFLDEMKNKRTFKGLTGKEWYKQQASRAVNQAVGRVLRHKEDYGAILFCDERFTYSSTTAELPKWMKPYVHIYNNFGELQKQLRNFFRRATDLCDASCMKVKKLTKEEVTMATEEQKRKTTAEQTENEDHWLPQAVIQGLKNTSKPEFSREEIAKKRVDYFALHMGGEKLPRTPITIQYDVLPRSVKENEDKNHATSTDDKQNCFFDSLQAYETAEKQKNTGQDSEVKQTSSKFSAYSPVVVETKHTAVKKKLKIVRPKPQLEDVEGEKATKSSAKADAVRTYLKKALKILGNEKYKELTDAIKQFKKDNDFQPLLLCMITVLLAEKEYHELYLGFTNHLPESKRKIYLQKYADITGEDIPEEYEKRKRNDKMEGTAPNKKIRTDS
ncbi:regulator of telomere elongation helicase 1-like, partial [Paramuricea clavata]